MTPRFPRPRPRRMPAGLASLASIIALTTCSAASAVQHAEPPPLALVGATIIDGTGAAPLAHRTILIANRRIEAIYADGSRPVPRDHRVIEATGEFVIPGLIDSHSHLATFPRDELHPALLRNMLMGGVTSVRDMGGNARRVRELARAVASDSLPGPRIYYSAVMSGAGWFNSYDPARVTYWSDSATPGSAPGLRLISDSSNIDALVHQASAIGATGIKIYADVSARTLTLLVSAAHARGLRVWSHAVVPPTRPEEVVASGVDVVSHADQLIFTAAARDDSVGSRSVRSRLLKSVTADDPAMRGLLAQMKAKGTLFEPTLLVMMLGAARAESGQATRVDSIVRWAVAITRAAHLAGVPIVAGTDAIGTVTPNLHSEMQILVDSAGLTPLEALRAATENGARALGLQDSLGSIAVGKLADLVILRADPSRDIRNTQTVHRIIIGGRPWERTDPWRAPQLARPPAP